MKSKEQQHKEGAVKDLNAERLEVGKELGLDEKIQAVDDIVVEILRKHLETATSIEQMNLVQVIVCSDKHKEAAWWISRKYKLELVTSPLMPDNEIFITSIDSVQELITSRFTNSNQKRIIK